MAAGGLRIVRSLLRVVPTAAEIQCRASRTAWITDLSRGGFSWAIYLRGHRINNQRLCGTAELRIVQANQRSACVSSSKFMTGTRENRQVLVVVGQNREHAPAATGHGLPKAIGNCRELSDRSLASCDDNRFATASWSMSSGKCAWAFFQTDS